MITDTYFVSNVVKRGLLLCEYLGLLLCEYLFTHIFLVHLVLEKGVYCF